MKMKHIIRFAMIGSLAVLLSLNASAQVKMGDNPTTIDDGSLLEMESTDKAFVPPRMTEVQMNAIPTPLEGATIYNTDKDCLYQFRVVNGQSQWVSFCQGNEMIVVSLETQFNYGYLNGGGTQTILNGIESANTLPGASFNNATNQITLPPGTYIMTMVYEGAIFGGGNPTISSYFFDFPNGAGSIIRIHNNQAHNPGGASNHGGNMLSAITLSVPTTFYFHIGRGQGGNFAGQTYLRAGGATFFSAQRLL